MRPVEWRAVWLVIPSSDDPFPMQFAMKTAARGHDDAMYYTCVAQSTCMQLERG